MGKLNHHAIYNGAVKITTSDVPFESNYDSVTDTDTTPIKSIDNDEMDLLSMGIGTPKLLRYSKLSEPWTKDRRVPP